MNKLTTLVAGALLLSSSFVSAKASYVTGTFAGINEEAKTISIVSEENGEVVKFKYSEEAFEENEFGKKIKFAFLKEGDDIVLKLEAAE